MSEKASAGSDIQPKEPPAVLDIRIDRVTKLWLRCPECGTVHEIWPKEASEYDEPADNALIQKVHDCWLSHEWTPDSWKEAHEQGLVPESWVETSGKTSTDSSQEKEDD